MTMPTRMVDRFSSTVIRYPALWNAFDKIASKNLRIMYYHMVTDKQREHYFDGRAITAESFIDVVKLFKSKFEIVSLSEAIARAEQGRSLEKCISFTFDDGFSECYSAIAPILHDEGLTATFFLIENTVDNQDLMWRNKLICIQRHTPGPVLQDALARLTDSNGAGAPVDMMAASFKWRHKDKDEFADRLWEESGLPPLSEWLDEHTPYMTTAQIRELLAAGFDIGCHSKSHPLCGQLTYPELEEEVVASARRLGRKFEREIRYFSYPFGDRAPRDYEERILEGSNLQCLLGIYDTARNGSDYRRWERQGLEDPSGRAVAKYFLGPIKKRAVGLKLRYRP